MKISRAGPGFTVQFTEHGVICGSCGRLFREFHVFSNRLVEMCPQCGHRGPFQKATAADIEAYGRAQVERQRLTPSDWVKAIVGLIICVGIALMIARWVVDA